MASWEVGRQTDQQEQLLSECIHAGNTDKLMHATSEVLVWFCVPPAVSTKWIMCSFQMFRCFILQGFRPLLEVFSYCTDPMFKTDHLTETGLGGGPGKVGLTEEGPYHSMIIVI